MPLQRQAGNAEGPPLFRIEHRGVAYRKAYGSRAIEPVREAMTEDTMFDAASLTKVVATTPAILLLIQRGQIELDAPASRYWPGFAAHGKDAIFIRHLLTNPATSSTFAGRSGTLGAEALVDAPE